MTDLDTCGDPTTTDETIAPLDPFRDKLEDLVYHTAEDWRTQELRFAIADRLLASPNEMPTVFRALAKGGDHASLWASLPAPVLYEDITPLESFGKYTLFEKLMELAKASGNAPVRMAVVDDRVFLYTLKGDS